MSANTFQKTELLEFISQFPKHTTMLDEPMISWVGDGAYSLPEAQKMVEDGFIPEGIAMCAKRIDEEYWESVFITKEDCQYNISTNDMSGLADRDADSIEEALKEAAELLKDYIFIC